MPITPDTKDWTWVLETACPECGFDVRSFPREEVGSMIRDNAAHWRPVLRHPQVGERPSDDVWSALEYACHVRDVFTLYDERLQMMLEEDDARFSNWDQDESAIAKDYGSQDPQKVAAELTDAANRLADRFDTVDGDAWERTGKRSDGALFTTESLARYLIHDPIHHLEDAEKGFAGLD
jgi:hypothetical protein